MFLLSWLAIHWFDLLQTVGIVGGLFFAGLSLHKDTDAQRVANLLNLTGQHRDIWKMLFEEPKLSRVLEPKIDLAKNPMTGDESRFVGFLILHLNASFKAIKAGVLMKAEGLASDIQQFFDLPIPQSVWQKLRKFYDADFVAFVETTNKKAPPKGRAD
ncbi:MAG TPA: hypothetical protein VK737_11360 [Opitutales bacterium]|jgi:hypothetical protein|nr:hypothetical protein [Opitutales bacterium]